MLKRKRGDEAGSRASTGSNSVKPPSKFDQRRRVTHESGETDQALSIRVSRFKAKFSQGQISLLAALKLARGFERQKLGRRQKQASQDNDGQKLLRIKEEIFFLKSLSLEATARAYLVKQCLKTKRIAEAEAFQKVADEGRLVLADEKGGARQGAEANVLARLFMAVPVKKVVPEIMGGLLRVLGIEKLAQAGGISNDRKHASDRANKDTVKTDLPEPTSQIEQDSVDSDAFEGFSEPETSGHELGPRLDEVGSDSNGEDHDNFDDYADRLASASDLDTDSASQTSDHDHTTPNHPQPQRSTRAQNHDRHRTFSISSSRSPSPSLSPAPPPAKSSKDARYSTKSTATATTITSSSSFLPSLGANYYYSGSESGDTPEPDEYTHPNQQPRKNRRGQRARQALAEKKYGEKAKHLRRQGQTKVSSPKVRSGGWDARKGAVDESGQAAKRGKLNGHGGEYVGGRSDQRSRGGLVGPSRGEKSREAMQKVDSGEKTQKIHPSWEAARKKKIDMKDQEFKGKKITFD